MTKTTADDISNQQLLDSIALTNQQLLDAIAQMFVETNERLDSHIESSDKQFNAIRTELDQMHNDFDRLHKEQHETGRKVETLRSGLAKAAHAAQ